MTMETARKTDVSHRLLAYWCCCGSRLCLVRVCSFASRCYRFGLFSNHGVDSRETSYFDNTITIIVIVIIIITAAYVRTRPSVTGEGSDRGSAEAAWYRLGHTQAKHVMCTAVRLPTNTTRSSLRDGLDAVYIGSRHVAERDENYQVPGTRH